jgi:hypothetical protein
MVWVTLPASRSRRRYGPIAPPAHEALLDWKASLEGVQGADTHVWTGLDGDAFAPASVMERALRHMEKGEARRDRIARGPTQLRQHVDRKRPAAQDGFGVDRPCHLDYR